MGAAVPALLSSPVRRPRFWPGGRTRGGVALHGLLFALGTAVLLGAPVGPSRAADAQGPPAPIRTVDGAPGNAVPPAPLRPALAPSASDWYNVTAESGTALPVLAATQGTWDGVDGAVLVFGGSNYVASLGSTWEYRSGTWVDVDPSDVPGALLGANLAYDANRSEVVLDGGIRSTAPGAFNNTTYTFAHGHWSAANLSPSPPPRLDGMMAYDPDLSGVVLFGGANASAPTGPYRNDLWLFRNGSWQARAAPGGPVPRALGQMTYDPDLPGLLLYGGMTSSGTILGDTWLFDRGSWTRLSPSASPPPLSGGALAYDAALGVAVLTGGRTSNGTVLDGTWTFDGRSWSALPTSNAPSPHDAGIGVYDPIDRDLVVTGGSPSGSFTDLLSSPMVLNVSVPPRADAGRPIGVAAAAAGGPPPFAYTYAFAWGDGSDSNVSGGAAVHTYDVPGPTTVRVTADGADGANVSAVATTDVHVAPSVTISGSAPGADVGVPLDLSATGSGGWGLLSYAWQFGDGGSGTGPSIAYVYGRAGTYPVTVWANDSIGGSGRAGTTVLVGPVPTLVVPTDGFVADAGLPAPLAVGVSNGTAPFAISWTFSDGATATGPRTIHVFPSAGSDTVGLTVSDAAGAEVSDVEVVNVALPLNVSIDGPGSLTAGSTGTWTAAVSGGTPPYRYLWALGDGENDSKPVLRHLFAGATGAAPIALTVTDALNVSVSVRATVDVRFGSRPTGLASLTASETLGLLALVGILCGGVLYALYGRGRPPSPSVRGRPARPRPPSRGSGPAPPPPS